MAALKPWLYFADAAHVDNGRTMNANEFPGVELFHERLQGLTYVIGAAPDVQPRIVPLGFDPVDVRNGNKLNPAVAGDGEALCVVQGRNSAAHQYAVC